MDCPTSGERCYYRTQFAKVQNAALFQTIENDDDLMHQVSNIFSEVVTIPEEARCTENYCSALGNAVVQSLLGKALYETAILRESPPEDEN